MPCQKRKIHSPDLQNFLDSYIYILYQGRPFPASQGEGTHGYDPLKNQPLGELEDDSMLQHHHKKELDWRNGDLQNADDPKIHKMGFEPSAS